MKNNTIQYTQAIEMLHVLAWNCYIPNKTNVYILDRLCDLYMYIWLIIRNLLHIVKQYVNIYNNKNLLVFSHWSVLLSQYKRDATFECLFYSKTSKTIIIVIWCYFCIIFDILIHNINYMFLRNMYRQNLSNNSCTTHYEQCTRQDIVYSCWARCLNCHLYQSRYL